MALSNIDPINATDFLEALRGIPVLAPYSFALLCDNEEIASIGRQPGLYCGVLGENSICAKQCRAPLEKAFRQAIETGKSTIFQCSAGLLNFAVPFHNNTGRPCCIIGGGVREETLDLSQMEELSNSASENGIALLEKLENVPCATRDGVMEAAVQVASLLPALSGENTFVVALDKLSQRLSAITEVSTAIDQAGSGSEITSLLSEALLILFDLPRIAIVLAEGESFSIKGALGFTPGPDNIKTDKVARFLQSCSNRKPVALKGEIAALFPDIGASQAICAPLSSENNSLGMIVLFDTELHCRDLLLIEILASRYAEKLLRMQKASFYGRQGEIASSLLSMISSLSIIDNRNELYHKTMEMAAELLQASRGSLMLIDETGQGLQIVAARGINMPLAKTMNIRMGEGIAGKVAKSGFHLLVSDIERDSRVGIPNRPRFKTKSFISFPLKVQDKIIGVINLADKETEEAFSDEDLKNLQTFSDHASLMIDRSVSLERFQQLEEMSVTDPLTGLYNRRFLESRFNEEINRGSRLNQAFTVMMIDLDFFKTYNDLCGHIAGDRALSKTAALLKKSAREMDTVARYGGEEFCILLPSTSKKESIFVAERIRRAIESHHFPGETELPLKMLTTSIGIASYPEDGEKPNELIHAADLALYQAKKLGRNRITLYEAKMQHQQNDTRTG